MLGFYTGLRAADGVVGADYASELVGPPTYSNYCARWTTHCKTDTRVDVMCVVYHESIGVFTHSECEHAQV